MNNMTKCSTRTSKDGQQYKDCPLSCWSNINVQDKAFCLYDSDCDNCNHVKIPMSSCLLTKNDPSSSFFPKYFLIPCLDDPIISLLVLSFLIMAVIIVCRLINVRNLFLAIVGSAI